MITNDTTGWIGEDMPGTALYRAVKTSTRVLLVVVGVVAFLRGVAYTPVSSEVEVPGGLRLITSVVPIMVWGIGWFAAAVVAWAGAVRARPLGLLGAVFMCIIWGMGYGASYGIAVWHWFMGGGPRDPEGSLLGIRDYLSLSLYLGVAGVLICCVRLSVVAFRTARKLGGGGVR